MCAFVRLCRAKHWVCAHWTSWPVDVLGQVAVGHYIGAWLAVCCMGGTRLSGVWHASNVRPSYSWPGTTSVC